MDKKILDEVDNYTEFLYVDELNERLFSMLGKENVIELGKSENGYPIYCGKIGNSPKNALVFGFPHPNEPVGSLTCLSLIKTLLNYEKLRNLYTWYIIPCADPDGAKLNEGWFKGDLSSRKLIFHYYRSKESIQTDWAFPIEYKNYKFDKVPKNVMALKNLIDQIKPDLIYPVHSTVMGGTFFFLSDPLSENYYDKIIALCREYNLPINFGEPDSQFTKTLKGPILLNYGLEAIYDYYEKTGKNPKLIITYGSDSISYAKKLNPKAFGIICEVPLMYDKKVENRTPIQRTKREVYMENLKYVLDVVDFVRKVINHPEINKSSIFYDLLVDTILREKRDAGADVLHIEHDKEYDEPSTVADEFDEIVLNRFCVYAPILGETRRLLMETKKSEERDKLLKEVEDRLDKDLDFCYKRSNYRIVSERNLVQVQLGFLLLTIEELNPEVKL